MHSVNEEENCAQGVLNLDFMTVLVSPVAYPGISWALGTGPRGTLCALAHRARLPQDPVAYSGKLWQVPRVPWYSPAILLVSVAHRALCYGTI